MRVNERMKKVFSILLCLCMVLQYVPTAAFAATEVPTINSQGFVTYADGVTQYVKYDNYLYKVTYTNLKNTDELYLEIEYGYLRLQLPEYIMMELVASDGSTELKETDLPKTEGGILNCYCGGTNRVIDMSAPVVIITCVAVNEPAWSWASDYSSATAVFTAREADACVTLSADASFVTEACSEGDRITYTASVTFNGNTYTDQQEDIKPHDWKKQEGPTCDQICSRCGTVQAVAHTYDNACDTSCNICGATRETEHYYDSDCDSKCNSCGVLRETTIAHTYDYDCDQDCNACGEARDAFHNVEDGFCTYCGMKHYGVLVAGVQISEENASDVLGDGTISYDASTNTLTLTGATVDASELNVPALEITDGTVTLVLRGYNALISYHSIRCDEETGVWYGYPAISIAEGASVIISGDASATLKLAGNDFGYTTNDHIPSASAVSGGSLIVNGGSINTENGSGIRLSGDYTQTGGTVSIGYLEAQNVSVSGGTLDSDGWSGISPKYEDPNAGGIHGIFAQKSISISGGSVTTSSGVLGHNGNYIEKITITGEEVVTHGLYALENITVSGGTVISTGGSGGYVIGDLGVLVLGNYEAGVEWKGTPAGAALEAPQWSISEAATFICGSDTSHRGSTQTCQDEQCAFCNEPFEEIDHSYDETTHICSVCGKAETFTVHWTLAGSMTESTSTFGQDFTHSFTVPENTHLRIIEVNNRADGTPVEYFFENDTLTIAAEDLPAADILVVCEQYVKVTCHANGGVIKPDDGFPVEGDNGFAENASYWVQEWPVSEPIYPLQNGSAIRTGYTFVEWRDESGMVYPTAGAVKATVDVTIYAQWQANTYTVTWNVDGETSTTQQTYDAALALPTAPEKEDCGFLGWFTAEEGGEQVTAETIFQNANNSTVYYARFCDHKDVADENYIGTLENYTPNADKKDAHDATWSCCGGVVTENCSDDTYTVSSDGAVCTLTCGLCKRIHGTVTIVAPACTVYGDGKSCEATILLDGEPVEGTIAFTYYQQMNGQWSKLEAAPTDAGTYRAEFVAFDDTYYDEKDIIIYAEYTIAKANSVLTAPTPISGLTYTGAAQNLVNEGDAVDGTMVYSLEENGAYSTNIPQGTNAGDYTVWYYVQGDANQNDSAKYSLTVTIEKADSTLTDPTAKIGLVYNGANQALVTAGQVVGGALQYSLDHVNWSAEIPAAANAGDYTVYYKVAGNDNYNGIAEKSLTVTIAQMDLAGATVTLSETSYTYDGQSHYPTVTVTLDGFGKLVEGKDYRVFYSGVRKMVNGKPVQWFGNHVDSADCINAGDDYHAVVIGLGNFYTADAFTLYENYVIQPKELTELTFDGLEVWYLYTGETIVPNFTLKDGETTLTEGEDYTVAITDNTDVGTATITVTLLGNYSGTVTKTFEIKTHVHKWSYSADGDTITATCEGTIGTCPNPEQSFTLNAPDVGYSGNPVEAEVTRDGTDLTYTLRYTGTNYDSADAPTNAGDYTVTMTVGDKSVSDTFTISPKDISKVASCQFSLTQTSFVYNGKSPVLNVTGVDSSVGSYTMQKGTDYTVGTVQVNAGSHKLTVTGKGNYTGTVELDYTITAKEVSIIGAVIQPVTYNPNGYTLTVTGATFNGVVDGETLAYTAEATLGNTNAVGEQDATVTVTLDNSNYTLEDATYETTVTINKAEPEIVWNTGYTNSYGKNMYITAYVNGVDGEMIPGTAVATVYDANGNALNSVTCTKTDSIGTYFFNWLNQLSDGTYLAAESYVVELTYQGNENYNAKTVELVTYTIAKADPVIGTVGCEMDLFDSTSISNVELTRTDMSVDGTLILTDSELTAGEGTYNWKFTPADTDNYNTITGTVVLNVTADVLEKIEANGNLEKDSYSYGDTFSIDGLTVTATYTTGATKDVTELVNFDNTLAVGQTSVKLTYQGKTCTVTGFTVAKKQLVIDRMAWDIPENAVYSGTAYNATLTGNLPEGVTVTKTGDTATNAGDYTAKAVFSLAEGYSADNYEIVNGEDLTADWTIAKKNIAGATITLGTALTYNGKQQTQTVTKVEIDGLTVTYTVSGNTGTDAKGYTLTVTGNGNFKGTATADWSIAKKNISGATITLGDSLTYNGNAQTQEVTEVKIGDLTVTYDVTDNEQTNAGNYTLTVTGNGNFEGSATADWSIAKAKLTITANNNSITYGDVPAANGVTGTGFVSSESIENLSGELTYSYNYEQFGNVGTYKITPSGVTSNNYEITFADGTLTVNAKDITVTADAVSKTYGDADPTLTYKVEGLVNGDELTGELKRAAGENVGDYAIEQNTLTAGNNYRLTYTGAKLTINAKAITEADVELNGSLTYNGKEQTQPITVTEGITYEVSGNKATNAGAYELTVKGTGNYTGSVTLDWTIAKAKLTITADSKVIYIGEKLPTLTYTTSGLVGGDKLTKEPVLTTNADADQAGSYTITAANADAGDNYTITYMSGSLTIMDKETEVETKIEQTELTEVPEGLKDTQFDTVEEIKEELISKILATSTGYSAENMVHYDVALHFSLDGGDSWILATEENFPTEGITVILPYPEGTNARDYEFVVSHMFTVTSQRLGTVAGEVEMPKVEETANGIRVTLNGLSPVTVAARYHDHTGGIATCTDKAVCTICGNAYGEVDKTNHAGGTEVKDAKEATCGAEGYTGDTYCKGCNEVVEKGTTIKATGEHTYGDWKVVKEPTKTTKGEKQRTCSVCGHVDSKEIPVLSDTPATGDNSNIMLYSSMFTVSLAGLVVLLLAARKRKQETA